MPSLRGNVVANFFGQGWSTLVNLCFIPLYIRYLGVEAYGLVGFFMVLQAWMMLLDAGLTPVLQRETARHLAGMRDAQSMRDLLRSLEAAYLFIALLVAGLIWAAAPWIATSWLKPSTLMPQAATDGLRLMGVLIATRVWEQAYRGVLVGMQRQVWLNSVLGAFATLRALGAAAVLAWVSPTVEAFFAWQALVSALTVAVCARQAYRHLDPAPRRARASLDALRGVGDFAGGMAATTLLGLLLTQTDKLLISKLLPLETFSYYMLAATVAGGLHQLVTPVSTAVYPRLTELVGRGDTPLLALTYREACQWLSAMLIPAALALAILPGPLLLAWTGNAEIAQRAAPALGLLALSTMCNGLVTLPYMLQLAHGWTGFAVRTNVLAVTLVIPALMWAIPRYGGQGAAAVWLAMELANLTVGMQFMHRRLLPAEKWPWYRDAIALPLLAGGGVAWLLSSALPTPSTPAVFVLTAGVTALAIGAASTLALPVPRRWIFTRLGFAR